MKSIGIISTEGEFIILKDVEGNALVKIEGKITPLETFYVEVSILADDIGKIQVD